MKKIIFIVVIVIIALAGIYFWNTMNKKAPGSQEAEIPQEINLALVAEGLTSPVALVSAPDGTGRMFLVEQTGVVKIIGSDGQPTAGNFLDIRNKLVTLSPEYDERGLLGLAFHPDFKENGRLFAYYSAPLRMEAPAGWDHTSVLSEFTVSQSNPNAVDPASEKIILQIDEPQLNHNGGHIAFGPDGYLYVPLGDGGQANDVGLGHSAIGNGQDLSTLLGKILRIDINKGNPYAVPSDNPFVGKDGLDEIYALGFRNPYHISFDSDNLFVADVGQNLWEEIDIVVKGGNYGWNAKEGNHCFDPASPDNSPDNCDSKGTFVDPVVEYGHDIGKAIIGGYVYKGKAIKGLEGKYIFADWSRGFEGGDGSIFAAFSEKGKWSFKELKVAGAPNGRLGLFIKGIGQGADNELYVLTSETLGPSGTTGKLFKIVASGGTSEANTDGEKVSIKNFSYNPQTLTVPKGTKVTWTNEDTIKHTVTRKDSFDSGLFGKGETFSFTFNETGTFDYTCTPHPFMKGKVVVE